MDAPPRSLTINRNGLSNVTLLLDTRIGSASFTLWMENGTVNDARYSDTLLGHTHLVVSCRSVSTVEYYLREGSPEVKPNPRILLGYATRFGSSC